MSETPRTDSEQDDCRNVALEFTCRNPPPQPGENLYVVPAEFARQLERELGEAKSDLANVRRERDQWAACFDNERRRVLEQPETGIGTVIMGLTNELIRAKTENLKREVGEANGLAEELSDYVTHGTCCTKPYKMDASCSCGLDDLLSKLKARSGT